MHSALCLMRWVQALHCSSWCLETYEAGEWLQAAQLADVKWQQAVFQVLLSYHPFWLRLGLETVVGQLLPADTGDCFAMSMQAASSSHCTVSPCISNGAVVFDPQLRTLKFLSQSVPTLVALNSRRRDQ